MSPRGHLPSRPRPLRPAPPTPGRSQPLPEARRGPAGGGAGAQPRGPARPPSAARCRPLLPPPGRAALTTRGAAGGARPRGEPAPSRGGRAPTGRWAPLGARPGLLGPGGERLPPAGPCPGLGRRPRAPEVRVGAPERPGPSSPPRATADVALQKQNFIYVFCPLHLVVKNPRTQTLPRHPGKHVKLFVCI